MTYLAKCLISNFEMYNQGNEPKFRFNSLDKSKCKKISKSLKFWILKLEFSKMDSDLWSFYPSVFHLTNTHTRSI